MCSNVDKDWAKKNTEFREIWLSLNLQVEKMKISKAIYTASPHNSDPCPTLSDTASLSPSACVSNYSSANTTHSSIF